MNARFQREIFINVMNYRLIILEELLIILEGHVSILLSVIFHVICYSL